jgi:hypothetical protein
MQKRLDQRLETDALPERAAPEPKQGSQRTTRKEK